MLSMISKLLNMAASLNITYHPLLENYPEFHNITKQPFNEDLKFKFSGMIDSGEV